MLCCVYGDPRRVKHDTRTWLLGSILHVQPQPSYGDYCTVAIRKKNHTEALKRLYGLRGSRFDSWWAQARGPHESYHFWGNFDA